MRHQGREGLFDQTIRMLLLNMKRQYPGKFGFVGMANELAEYFLIKNLGWFYDGQTLGVDHEPKKSCRVTDGLDTKFQGGLQSPQD